MVNHGTGPRAARVPHPGAGADRLPLGVPHRHARHRAPEPPVRRLGAVARATSRAGPPARSSPTARAGRPATRSTTSRRAATSSSGPAIPVYEGQVVGEHVRENDLDVNVTGEEAHQHARVHPRRGIRLTAAARHEPRAVPGVDPRRRAGRGHAQSLRLRKKALRWPATLLGRRTPSSCSPASSCSRSSPPPSRRASRSRGAQVS